MVKGDDLDYPNLEYCSIIPALSVGTSHIPPSVSISPKCLDAISTPIPAVYDFEIGTIDCLLACKHFKFVALFLTFSHTHSFSLYHTHTHLTESNVVEHHVGYENSNQSVLIREPPEERQSISTGFTPPQRETLQRMKSVTNATDDVCSSILIKNNFNLNSSIDSYFLGER